MVASMSGLRLLVLDFDGVCTAIDRELDAEQHLTLAQIIRPEADQIVAEANQSGLVTAILSNEIDPAWAEQVELLSMVDHVVSCADNKIFKPDRRAFQRCALLVRCEPEEVLVVDDGRDNVTVARSLGMRALLFDVSDPELSWKQVRDELRRP